MMYDLFRTQLRETQDDGDQQTVTLYGVGGEELTRVHRVQQFGRSAIPPVGSHGIGMALYGRRDLVVALGLEHPHHRPRLQSPGEHILYDAFGSAISMVQQNMRFVHPQKVEHAVGGVTMTLTAEGLAITGGRVTHDGRSIGSDHTHGGVVPGGGTTDIPAN
jgi:phage gp45-like